MHLPATLWISTSAALLAISALAACAASPPAQSPEGTTSPPGATPGSSVAPAQDAGPTTTTTLTLGKGGDLSGSKLTSSGSQTINVTIDGGPSGPHTPDIGRGMKDIQAIVVARRDDARACYDNALKAHPGIEGNLDIKWTIDPKGVVTDIAVDTSHSDILEPSVGNCVIAIIKKIHFNESAKGFETFTHYPFNFHPRSGGVMVIQDAGTH